LLQQESKTDPKNQKMGRNAKQVSERWDDETWEKEEEEECLFRGGGWSDQWWWSGCASRANKPSNITAKLVVQCVDQRCCTLTRMDKAKRDITSSLIFSINISMINFYLFFIIIITYLLLLSTGKNCGEWAGDEGLSAHLV